MSAHGHTFNHPLQSITDHRPPSLILNWHIVELAPNASFSRSFLNYCAASLASHRNYMKLVIKNRTVNCGISLIGEREGHKQIHSAVQAGTKSPPPPPPQVSTLSIRDRPPPPPHTHPTHLHSTCKGGCFMSCFFQVFGFIGFLVFVVDAIIHFKEMSTAGQINS